MTEQITLTKAQLHTALTAVLPHAGTDITRPHLNTVHIIATGTTVRFEATDSYTLGVYRTTVETPGQLDVLITLDDAKQVLRTFKPTKKAGDHNDPVTITLTPDRSSITFASTAGSLVADTVDATYPRIGLLLSRAIHRAPGGTGMVGLDLVYAARWVPAAEPGHPVRFFFGDGPHAPVLVVGGRSFIGLMMPCKTEASVSDGAAELWGEEFPARPVASESAA